MQAFRKKKECYTFLCLLGCGGQKNTLQAEFLVFKIHSAGSVIKSLPCFPVGCTFHAYAFPQDSWELHVLKLSLSFSASTRHTAAPMLMSVAEEQDKHFSYSAVCDACHIYSFGIFTAHNFFFNTELVLLRKISPSPQNCYLCFSDCRYCHWANKQSTHLSPSIFFFPFQLLF